MLFLKTALRRLHASFTHLPTHKQRRRAILYFFVYALTTAVVAYGTKFVRFHPPPDRTISAKYAIVCFFAPALAEECIFRAALLPHPTADSIEAFRPRPVILYGAASVCTFVLYHLSPFHKPRKVFRDARFLMLAGILGVTCVAVYLETGSIWMPTIYHYTTVVVWVLLFGGYNALHPPNNET